MRNFDYVEAGGKVSDDVDSSTRESISHVSNFPTEFLAWIAALADPDVIVELFVFPPDSEVVATPHLGINREQVRVSKVMTEHVI